MKGVIVKFTNLINRARLTPLPFGYHDTLYFFADCNPSIIIVVRRSREHGTLIEDGAFVSVSLFSCLRVCA